MIMWADIESTGLNEHRGELLEVALFPTTDLLEQIDNGISVVISGDMDCINDLMSTEVKLMHTRSGLLQEVSESSCGLLRAEKQLLEYMEQFDSQDLANAPLAGNNIQFDRRWISRFMPKVISRLHYRNICVSSEKETCRRFFSEVYRTAPAKQYHHRAMMDVHESIMEYRHYVVERGSSEID